MPRGRRKTKDIKNSDAEASEHEEDVTKETKKRKNESPEVSKKAGRGKKAKSAVEAEVQMESKNVRSVDKLLDLSLNIDSEEVRKKLLPMLKPHLLDYIANDAKRNELISKDFKKAYDKWKLKSQSEANDMNESLVHALREFELMLLDKSKALDLGKVTKCLKLFYAILNYSENVSKYFRILLLDSNALELLKGRDDFKQADHAKELLTEIFELTKKNERVFDLQKVMFKKNVLRDEFCVLNISKASKSIHLLNRVELSVLEDICDALQIRTSLLSSDYKENYSKEVLLTILSNKYDFHLNEEHETLCGNEKDLFSFKNAYEFNPVQFASLKHYLKLHLGGFAGSYFSKLEQIVTESLKQLKPSPILSEQAKKLNFTQFNGWSRNVLPISDYEVKFASHHVVTMKNVVDENSVVSEELELDISISMSRFSDVVRAEWEVLEEGETLYLISVKSSFNQSSGTNYGIEKVRGVRFVGYVQEEGAGNLVRDEHGKPYLLGEKMRVDGGNSSKLVLRIASSELGTLEGYNLVLKLNPSMNNYKQVSSTVKSIVRNNALDNNELCQMILGYGNPEEIVYSNEKALKLKESKKKLSKDQKEALNYLVGNTGMLMLDGLPGTGKSFVLAEYINSLLASDTAGKILLVTRTGSTCDLVLDKLDDSEYIMRIGHTEDEFSKYSKPNRVKAFLKRRDVLLNQVKDMVSTLNYSVGDVWQSTYTAVDFYDTVLSQSSTFPFTDYYGKTLGIKDTNKAWSHLKHLFTELKRLKCLDLLSSNYERANYLMRTEMKLIAVTSTNCLMRLKELSGINGITTVIVDDAHMLDELNSFIPLSLLLRDGSLVKNWKAVMAGIGPEFYSNKSSLYNRLLRLGVPSTKLLEQHRFTSEAMRSVMSSYYTSMKTSTKEKKSGVARLIDVSGEFSGQEISESEPRKGLYQNLAEAEYIVAYYQRLRLYGVPAKDISILTPYQGQASLINGNLFHWRF